MYRVARQRAAVPVIEQTSGAGDEGIAVVGQLAFGAVAHRPELTPPAREALGAAR